MTSEKIIDILKNGKIHLSCELFPPKQGAELQNSLEIVNKIAASTPSYMSVTYGAGGSTVGYSAALADMQGEEIGSFAHASELMRFVKQQGDFCVGGAAYPEGHPESGSLEKDIENTKYKVDAGVDFLVTQMFFDNTILYNYMFRLLRAGINVPVVPGIMPVTNAKQIIRICQLSGTKLPPQFRAMVEKFADKPEALKQAGIAYATGQIIDLIANGFDNVHIYTMNKPEIFAGIMNNLGEIVDK